MSIRSVKVKAGDKVIIPNTAIVKSVSKKGAANATSDCETIQDIIDNAEAYQCYEFVYGVDTQESERVGDDVLLRKLYIGKTVYELEDIPGDTPGSFGNDDELLNALKAKFPTDLVNVYEITKGGGGNDYDEMRIKVEMTPTVAAETKLYLNMQGFYGLYVDPLPIDCPE